MGKAEPEAGLRAAPPLRLVPTHLRSRMEMRDNLRPGGRVHWRAAILAGLIAGGIVWLFSHGLPWFTSGMITPTLMGRHLKPPGLVIGSRSVAIGAAHLVVAVLYTLAIASLISKVRGLWALALGGVLGLILYCLNFAFFRVAQIADWSGTELPILVTHAVFGAVAAGLYKGMTARHLAPGAT
jgi:hypothetical protein